MPSILSVLLFAGCAGASPNTTEPLLPGTTSAASQFRSAAFVLDVSTTKRTIRVSAPMSGLGSKATMTGVTVHNSHGPHFSLLGADVIEMTASNYVAGVIGTSVPGKVLVTFDITLHNRLNGIRLITPTFPTPPAGVTGVQAFPFEISVITSAGGVGTNGNELLVTSPRFGAVIPSNHWDGAPHNFFNDAICTGAANDCFRYEPFGVIGPLGKSEVRQVGFLVDPTVGDLRVRLIVAANVQAVTMP